MREIVSRRYEDIFTRHRHVTSTPVRLSSSVVTISSICRPSANVEIVSHLSRVLTDAISNNGVERTEENERRASAAQRRAVVPTATGHQEHDHHHHHATSLLTSCRRLSHTGTPAAVTSSTSSSGGLTRPNRKHYF